jgi:hypothetical protein
MAQIISPYTQPLRKSFSMNLGAFLKLILSFYYGSYSISHTPALSVTVNILFERKGERQDVRV